MVGVFYNDFIVVANSRCILQVFYAVWYVFNFSRKDSFLFCIIETTKDFFDFHFVDFMKTRVNFNYFYNGLCHKSNYSTLSLNKTISVWKTKQKQLITDYQT